MGCGASRSAVHPTTSASWNRYCLLRNADVALQYGSWARNNSLSNEHGTLPPPYSEVVPEGHVSLSRRCNMEGTVTDWQEETLPEDLPQRLASLRTTDNRRQIRNCTERSLPTNQRQKSKQQRRATRSAPDLSVPSRCSTLTRPSLVFLSSEQRQEVMPENPRPNTQHSQQAFGTNSATLAGRGIATTRSVSPAVRSPDAVREERFRRKRIRRRLTPQRLNFRDALEGRRRSDGALLPPSILERNRSMPEFDPFVMSVTPMFQFGTPVRQRSTSTPLPVTPVSFREINCNTTLCTPETESSGITNLERVERTAAKNHEQLPGIHRQRASMVHENPFQIPNFSRSKLPPIKYMPQRSRNVERNSSVRTVLREPGELQQTETSKD